MNIQNDYWKPGAMDKLVQIDSRQVILKAVSPNIYWRLYTGIRTWLGSTVPLVVSKISSRIPEAEKPLPTAEFAYEIDAAANAFAPMIQATANDSANRTARRLQSRAGMSIDWRKVNPKIIESARSMSFDFCEETLKTAIADAETVYRRLREELSEGLLQGEPSKLLTRRIRRIFRDPARAHRIATTETSRAVHMGQVITAEESGAVRGLRWLASPDACDKCRAVHGQVVALGQPFTIIGLGKYGTIYHPPYHPYCFCTVTEVI